MSRSGPWEEVQRLKAENTRLRRDRARVEAELAELIGVTFGERRRQKYSEDSRDPETGRLIIRARGAELRNQD